jgi:acetyl-CoA C-acetyltransferase
MGSNVVIAGWGQVVQRKEHTGERRGPLGLMGIAAQRAAETASDPDILRQVDAIFVVRPMSAHVSDGEDQLADQLGASPRLIEVSRIGGNSPQTLVDRAAGMIARGQLDRVLVVGAEAYYRNRLRGLPGDQALFAGVQANYDGDDLRGATDLEQRHGIVAPIHGFPLFETALWARSGMDLKAWRRRVGAIWAGFSEVAARNPYAWTQQPRTADEIITPSPDNRRITFPYTKFMNSLVTVDQGAAVILAREDLAPARPGARPVYFRGGATTEDRQRFLIEKSNFTRNAALGAAATRAMERAGLEVGEIQAFDLYSCFPCAVTIACRELGLWRNDPRPLTLTGGLGFFGGPGNDYNLHAIATLAEKIATGELDNGLVTALSWFLHKHAAGVYAAEPGDAELARHDLEDAADPLVGAEPVQSVDTRDSEGVVETYTALYDRSGEPTRLVLYVRQQDGRRFVASLSAEGFTERRHINLIGERVRVVGGRIS